MTSKRAFAQPIAYRGLPVVFLLLRQQPIRFLTAITGIAFAVVLMLMQLGFRDALLVSSTALQQMFDSDIVMISRKSVSTLTWMSSFPYSDLVALRAMPAVEDVAPVRLGYMRWKLKGSDKARLIISVGIDPVKSQLFGTQMRNVMYRLAIPGRVIFDRLSRPEYGPVAARFEAGGPVFAELEDQRVRVAGLTRIGNSFGADAIAVMSNETYNSISSALDPGEIELGLVRLRSGNSASLSLPELQRILPEDVILLTRKQFLEFEMNFWDKSKPIGFVFAFGVVMGFAVGALIVYQILYSDVSYHLSEYATLLAIGYGRGFLERIVAREAIVLSFFGFPPAYLTAQLLYYISRVSTNLPLYMTAQRTISTFLLTLSMCVLSALLAMRRLRDASPADAFT